MTRPLALIRATYRWLTRHRRERLAEEARQRRIDEWQHRKLLATLEHWRLWCLDDAPPVYDWTPAPRTGRGTGR